MKTLSVGCLGLIIGLIAGAGLVLFATSNAFKPSPTVAPPADSARSEISINVSAAYAAAQVQRALRASGIAKNAAVTFAAPNLIRVATTVEVNALGIPLSVNANVAMSVAVQRGRIALTVESVDAAGFTLSPSVISSTVEPVRAQAEDEINRVVARALQGSTLHVANIRIAPDAVTVELSSQ